MTLGTGAERWTYGSQALIWNFFLVQRDFGDKENSRWWPISKEEDMECSDETLDSMQMKVEYKRED
jgi:hypothetical protein